MIWPTLRNLGLTLVRFASNFAWIWWLLKPRRKISSFWVMLKEVQFTNINVLANVSITNQPLGNVYGAWVGAKLCQAPGCPKTASGAPAWAWESVRRLFKPDRYQNWSKAGAKGLAQPDNYTGREACMAVLAHWYEDGMVWHDMECEDELPFICEK